MPIPSISNFQEEGIGVALFQCAIIVEAHRGRIEVEGALSQGTLFTVLLPNSSASASAVHNGDN